MLRAMLQDQQRRRVQCQHHLKLSITVLVKEHPAGLLAFQPHPLRWRRGEPPPVVPVLFQMGCAEIARIPMVKMNRGGILHSGVDPRWNPSKCRLIVYHPLITGMRSSLNQCRRWRLASVQGHTLQQTLEVVG